MELVGEASNGREALDLFRKCQPDVTLMDLQMPEMSGIDAISAIRGEFPEARIIVLTTHPGDVQVLRALQAGARAYLLKGLLRKELLETIRAVHAGQKRLSSEAATGIAEYAISDALTPREIDVLRLIAAGNANTDRGDGEKPCQKHSRQTWGQRSDPRSHDRTEAGNHRSIGGGRYPSKEGCGKRRSEVLSAGPTAVRLGWDGLLQRLFSTFPDRWPGFGLLLLRLGLGLRVIYVEILNLSGKSSEPTGLAQSLIALVGSIFLLAGLWTPIVGTLLALDEVWIAVSVSLSNQADIVIPVFLAVLCTSVAMLGPGAWSVDARLFGRRRLYHDRNRGRKSSS
jgi:CheY-like chemotaxis protein/uncharacterized membrane protein YphA (DoxX/SURF4 family)